MKRDEKIATLSLTIYIRRCFVTVLLTAIAVIAVTPGIAALAAIEETATIAAMAERNANTDGVEMAFVAAMP